MEKQKRYTTDFVKRVYKVYFDIKLADKGVC